MCMYCDGLDLAPEWSHSLPPHKRKGEVNTSVMVQNFAVLLPMLLITAVMVLIFPSGPCGTTADPIPVIYVTPQGQGRPHHKSRAETSHQKCHQFVCIYMLLAFLFVVARGGGYAASNWQRLFLPRIRSIPRPSVKIGYVIAKNLISSFHIMSKISYSSFEQSPIFFLQYTRYPSTARGSSLAVNDSTLDVQVTSDRPSTP